MGRVTFVCATLLLLLSMTGCGERFSHVGDVATLGKTVPGWILAAEQGDTHQRQRAIMALGRIRVNGHREFGEIDAVLVSALGDEDKDVRSLAAAYLHYIGEGNEAAQPELVKLLMDEDPALRLLATQAIPTIKTPPGTAIPALTPLLDDVDSGVRVRVASALGKYGPAAKEAIPQIEALRELPDYKSFQHIVEGALEKIRKDDTVDLNSRATEIDTTPSQATE